MSGTLVTRSVPGWKEMSRQRVIIEIRLTVTEMGDFKHHQPLQVHSANHLLFVCVCLCRSTGTRMRKRPPWSTVQHIWLQGKVPRCFIWVTRTSQPWRPYMATRHTHTSLLSRWDTHTHSRTRTNVANNTLSPCQSKHSFAWKVNNPQPSGHNYIFNTFIHIQCDIIWIFRQTARQSAVWFRSLAREI